MNLFVLEMTLFVREFNGGIDADMTGVSGLWATSFPSIAAELLSNKDLVWCHTDCKQDMNQTHVYPCNMLKDHSANYLKAQST